MLTLKLWSHQRVWSMADCLASNMKNSSVCAVEDAATEIGARETVRAFSLLEQTSLPRLGQMFRSLCAQPHSILCARSQRLNRSLRYIAEVVRQDAQKFFPYLLPATLPRFTGPDFGRGIFHRADTRVLHVRRKAVCHGPNPLVGPELQR